MHRIVYVRLKYDSICSARNCTGSCLKIQILSLHLDLKMFRFPFKHFQHQIHSSRAWLLPGINELSFCFRFWFVVRVLHYENQPSMCRLRIVYNTFLGFVCSFHSIPFYQMFCLVRECSVYSKFTWARENCINVLYSCIQFIHSFARLPPHTMLKWKWNKSKCWIRDWCAMVKKRTVKPLRSVLLYRFMTILFFRFPKKAHDFIKFIIFCETKNIQNSC